MRRLPTERRKRTSPPSFPSTFPSGGRAARTMSEMIATANARSIEGIKSFLSRQKETYKIPYETHPADRMRQCVFGGSSNTLDFLPLDRTGNWRFVPVMVYPERAEVHILADEEASRAYINQMRAEAMESTAAGTSGCGSAPQWRNT